MTKRLNRNWRSQSKTSETSLKVFQVALPFPIPEYKWREIFEEEHNSSVVNYVLNDIIALSMEKIYNVHLEKAVYSFVVHCSHSAWLQLFDIMDLQYDLGENSASIRKYWKGDKDIKPPTIDSLCFKHVEIRRQSNNCSFSECFPESLN